MNKEILKQMSVDKDKTAKIKALEEEFKKSNKEKETQISSL